jgi:NAD(P)-dependent dehydrogenase (short-subunit alcohol dehydrogenase family)
MPIIVITGAASGLGQAFLQAYLLDSCNTILAADREPIPLPTLSGEHAVVHRKTLDITSESMLLKWSEELECRQDKSIDLVIHCVGIRGLVPQVEMKHLEDVAACESMEVMDSKTMRRAFEINALGAFNLMKTLLPYLRPAAKQDLTRKPKVIVMSSRMGSIAANTGGSAYAYRASKAALNAIIKSFSIDVPEIVWVLVHPGRVETKLVKWREEGAISAEESIQDMMKLISQFGKGNSGKFYDRFGNEIPW